MSFLYLDDVGYCLLERLEEAWTMCETHTKSSYDHRYLVTSTNELWQRHAEYEQARQDYVDHLRFIVRASWDYQRYLTHNLYYEHTADIMTDSALYDENPDVADSNWVAKMSISVYRNCLERTP